MYTDNYKVWRRLPTPAKIWALFKNEFTHAHNEFRETQQTTRSTGFHVNNAEEIQSETLDTTAQLVNAIIADRSAMITLVTTVSNLMIELYQTNDKLVTSIE